MNISPRLWQELCQRVQPAFLFIHLFMVVRALLLKRMCVSVAASNKVISQCIATCFFFNMTKTYVTILWRISALENIYIFQFVTVGRFHSFTPSLLHSSTPSLHFFAPSLLHSFTGSLPVRFKLGSNTQRCENTGQLSTRRGLCIWKMAKSFSNVFWLTMAWQQVAVFFLGRGYQLQTHTFHVLPESIADHELKRNLLENVDDSLMSLRFLSTESFFKGFCTNLRTRALSRSSYQGTTRYSSKFGD